MFWQWYFYFSLCDIPVIFIFYYCPLLPTLAKKALLPSPGFPGYSRGGKTRAGQYCQPWNCVRRTSWGWWYEWGDTALQTHDFKLSHVGLRPSTLSLGHVGRQQYSIFTIEQGGNILFFETWNAKAGDESAISDFPSRHQGPRPLVLLLHIYKHITWLLIARWCAMYSCWYL